jgi:hypothetical protein
MSPRARLLRWLLQDPLLHLLAKPRWFFAPSGIPEKSVEIVQARTGDDAFPTDVRELAEQIPQQVHLQRILRHKGGMPALRREGPVLSPIPAESCFPKPRPLHDDRAVAGRA